MIRRIVSPGLLGASLVLLSMLVSAQKPQSPETFNIEIFRQYPGGKCTSGYLAVNGKIIAYTLELPWKDNTEYISSIPAGTYRGMLRYDHNDHWRIQLFGVPKRTVVQIHTGNVPKNIEGCILVGDKLGPDLCSLVGGTSVPAYRRLKAAFYGSENPISTPDKTITVTVTGGVSIAPKGVVSTSLKVSPNKGPYSIGQKLDGTFTLTNRGSLDLVMRQVLISGKVDGTCPYGVCPGFTPVNNITLAPGETYSYSGTFVPSAAGFYTLSVAYQETGGKWVNPAETETSPINKTSTINQVSLVVQNTAPKLTGKTPTTSAANPKPQIIYLSGSGLTKTLYCYLQFPNGSGTYLYVPTGEIFSRKDDQLGLKIKLTSRGKYYIWAHTMDGNWSNGLPFVVN